MSIVVFLICFKTNNVEIHVNTTAEYFLLLNSSELKNVVEICCVS